MGFRLEHKLRRAYIWVSLGERSTWIAQIAGETGQRCDP
jgi:hypothetical protein